MLKCSVYRAIFYWEGMEHKAWGDGIQRHANSATLVYCTFADSVITVLNPLAFLHIYGNVAEFDFQISIKM